MEAWFDEERCGDWTPSFDDHVCRFLQEMIADEEMPDDTEHLVSLFSAGTVPSADHTASRNKSSNVGLRWPLGTVSNRRSDKIAP